MRSCAWSTGGDQRDFGAGLAGLDSTNAESIIAQREASFLARGDYFVKLSQRDRLAIRICVFDQVFNL